MSGGSYDYAYGKVEDMAGNVVRRHDTALRRAFVGHLRLVAEAMRAVEWVDSGDWGRGDEDEAIRAVLAPGAEIQAAADKAREAMAELQAVLAKVAT